MSVSPPLSLSLPDHRRPLSMLCGVALLGLLPAPSATGLVVQGDGMGINVPAAVSDAFGRWGNNAAAVAVAPDWVLTTRHQDSLGSPPDRTVVFGSTSYTAQASDPASVIELNQDLRLVRVTQTDGTPATLTSTLSVYDGIPLTTGTTLTLGGFGPRLGSPGADGFDYAGNLDNTNGLRFGTNVLDGSGTFNNPGNFYNGMAVLASDFDDSGSPESTAGPGDSGGAWLVNTGGVFQIVGLSFAVENDRLDNPATPINEATSTDAFFTQQLFAADTAAFAATINAIPEPGTAAAFAAFSGLLISRRRRS